MCTRRTLLSAYHIKVQTKAQVEHKPGVFHLVDSFLPMSTNVEVLRRQDRWKGVFALLDKCIAASKFAESALKYS